MTNDELKIWDMYAAAALNGLLADCDTSLSSELAAKTADLMMKERAKRADKSEKLTRSGLPYPKHT